MCQFGSSALWLHMYSYSCYLNILALSICGRVTCVRTSEKSHWHERTSMHLSLVLPSNWCPPRRRLWLLIGGGWAEDSEWQRKSDGCDKTGMTCYYEYSERSYSLSFITNRFLHGLSGAVVLYHYFCSIEGIACGGTKNMTQWHLVSLSSKKT